MALLRRFRSQRNIPAPLDIPAYSPEPLPTPEPEPQPEPTPEPTPETQGFWSKVGCFFKTLFGGSC